MNRFKAISYVFIIIIANTVIAEDHHKRAPSGFTGVRGKKSGMDSTNDSFDKDFNGPECPDFLLKPEDCSVAVSDGDRRTMERVPSGFVGIRGMKPFAYLQPRLGTYPDTAQKRVPSGFMGLRGKKDNEFVQFGKKHTSGFFGVRGKKYPYEFRGKFVGVRGKKMLSDITSPEQYANLDLQQLGENLNINQLMLLLTEQNEVDKKNMA